MEDEITPEHLGDGVYVSFDGHQIARFGTRKWLSKLIEKARKRILEAKALVVEKEAALLIKHSYANALTLGSLKAYIKKLEMGMTFEDRLNELKAMIVARDNHSFYTQQDLTRLRLILRVEIISKSIASSLQKENDRLKVALKESKQLSEFHAVGVVKLQSEIGRLQGLIDDHNDRCKISGS